MQTSLKKHFPLLLLITLACAVRLWWVFHINYFAEDSYITFQFARNLAHGKGFAFNPGQPVYGTTTPLLTILMAGWLSISKDVELGAHIIDLLAVLGGMAFMYLAIHDKRVALIALFITSISSRLYIEEMQGMEMPLTFLFLAASYYGFIRKRPVFSGIMAGLLLWSRVDAVLWVCGLFAIYLLIDWHQAFKYFLATTAIYLPWIIFAWLYFGSPIPLTFTAKQIAYGVNKPPPLDQLLAIIRYISWPMFILTLLSIPSVLKSKYFWAFPLFVIVEITQLTLLGTTYFYRYFYLLTLVCYILLGFGISDLLERLKFLSFEWQRYLLPASLLLIAIFSLSSINASMKYHAWQDSVFVHMGKWINSNTPPGSTVLLEPLGYASWYADRVMIDEVGLITPKIVELGGRVPSSEYFRVFWPDYVIWSCNAGGSARTEIAQYYDQVQVFGDQTRTCLYEIWKRKPTVTLITQVHP